MNDSDDKLNSLIIGLIAGVGIMVLGYVAILIGCCVRRRKENNSRTKGVKYFKTGSEFAPQGAAFESAKHSGAYDPPKH